MIKSSLLLVDYKQRIRVWITNFAYAYSLSHYERNYKEDHWSTARLEVGFLFGLN